MATYIVDLVTEDSFYENLTLGVTKILESNPRICNVVVDRRMPCERISITNWEQKHSVTLPDDLKYFYASIDGFSLKWNFKYSAEENLQVGAIKINRLCEFSFTPALKELVDLSMSVDQTEPRPSLDVKSKLFELESCQTGKICMIYIDNKWSVWYLTELGNWAWLSDSFTKYFRMSLVHLGLPGWQSLFSNQQLVPWAQQLFNLIAPHLLEKSEEIKPMTPQHNHIDVNIFKVSSKSTSKSK